MMLNKISDHIYTLGEPDSTVEAGAIGVIHPYYFMKGLDDGLEREAYFPLGSAEEYAEALGKLVREHKGPVVVWEEKGRLTRTAEHLFSLGRQDNTYFIETKEGTSDTCGSWSEVSGFLDPFKGMPMRLVGGYLNDYIYSTQEWGFLPLNFRGCVGWLESMLRNDDFEVEIVESITFSSKPLR